MLLLQTLIICILIRLNHRNSWYSYILFLVFLGGILVLFIYLVSLASNEIFNFSYNIIIIFFLFIFVFLLIYLFSDLFSYILNLINRFDVEELSFINNLDEVSDSIYKLYNYSTNIFTLFIIIYLFFSLIVIVKITNRFYGPLRSLR